MKVEVGKRYKTVDLVAGGYGTVVELREDTSNGLVAVLEGESWIHGKVRWAELASNLKEV